MARLGHDEACDQPRLVIRKLPHAALRRLAQPDEEKSVALAMEAMDEQLGAALLVENIGRVHEREAHPEAGRPYEKVDLLLASIGEDNALPAKALDAGLGHDAAVHDVIEIDGAGSGMRLEQLVVR